MKTPNQLSKEDVLSHIKNRVKNTEIIKAKCTDKALDSLQEWAETISDLQNQYRDTFDNNKEIVSICHSCSMCCANHIGTGGHLSAANAFYYSMLDIDFDKYVNKNETGMCLFWSPEAGCNLPSNARPAECIKYVCSINEPLKINNDLAEIAGHLQDLYGNIPLEIDADKLRSK